MASFSQDVRTSTIILSRPGQPPCFAEHLNGPTGVKDIMGSSKGLPCSGLANCQTNDIPGTSITYSPDSGIIPVASPSYIQGKMVKENSGTCTQTSFGVIGLGNQPSNSFNKADGNSNCMRFHSTAVQNEKRPCEPRLYPSGHKNSMEKNLSHPSLVVQHSESFITVPFGWKRVITSGKVLYVSPSEIYLHSLQEVAIYLQTEGTCKCGLECPLMINKVFNFDPMATTKSWNVKDFSWNDPTKLCNHKRKILAMATFQNSTNPLSTLAPVKKVNPLSVQPAFKKDVCLPNKKKRLKGKSRSPFDGVLVSQLLAQRDKLGLRKEKSDNGSQKPNFIEAPVQCCNPQVVSASKDDTTANVFHGRYTTVDQRKSSPKSTVLVPMDEQNVPVLNKLNNAVSYSNLQMNQSICVSDGMNFYQDKQIPNCMQSIQQCTPDNSTSVVFHKHLSTPMPCVLPEQVIPRNNNNSLCNERVSSISTIDQQNFRLPVHQGLFNAHPQFIQSNNSIPASLTLNCGSFASQNMGNQVISTQLSVNQCVDMNNHNQATTGLVTAVSQPSNPGAFMFRTEATNQSINSNVVPTSYINTAYGPSFTPALQNTQQASSLGFNCSRFPQPNEDALNIMSRQKVKKLNKSKSCKLNCVLDRNSPCPNVDVRQIPSEHHRPPPEAFAAVVNQTSSGNMPTVIPGQNSSLHQVPGGNNLNSFTSDVLINPYSNNSASVLPQNVQCRSNIQRSNCFVPAKTPEPQNSNRSSPYLHSPNPTNKNVKTIPFVPFQDPTSFGQVNRPHLLHGSNIMNKSHSQMPLSNDMFQNNQLLPPGCHPSVVPTSMSGKVQSIGSNGMTMENMTSECNMPIKHSADLNSGNICNMYSVARTLNNCGVSDTRNLDTTHSGMQSVAVSNVGTTYSMSPLIMPVSSNNYPSVNIHQTPNCQTVFTSVNSNIINLPMNTVSQNHLNGNFSGVCATQGLNTCSPQIRANIAVSQQPLVYSGTAMPNNHQKNDTTTNFYVQNPGPATIDGMTSLRPSIVQDSSGILVQQVLSQKISSEYSPGNIFSSSARAQVVQQVSGMVLPAGAQSPANSHQVVLAPTQMRMSGPGGLITMLPPGMQNNSVMAGTHVLTTPQQLGPQMVIPDGVRPNMVNPHQQILQNNCFIMSHQPTLVARPQTTMVTGSPISCQTSVPLTISNGNAGNCFTFAPNQNINCSPLLTGPLNHKAQECNELQQQHLSCEEMQALSTGKEQNTFATSFHVLQSSTHNLPGQKPDNCDFLQDGWLQKHDMKNSVNDYVNQVTRTVLGNAPNSAKSGSVPSNISAHAVLSSCGQVYISGDSGNCGQPQSVTVSNMPRMTGVIPVVGNQSLNSPMPPMSIPNVTAVTTTMTQMIPAIGLAPQILGQPVQPMVQVINTVPFNSMQNAVIVPGGSNMLSQTVRLDALQTSPVVGTQTPTVFNGMVLPPNSMSCVSASSIPNMTSFRTQHPGISVTNYEEMKIGSSESGYETRGTPGSISSCSTPASSCSTTPVPSCNDTPTAFRALSPAVRKRSRDGKRKANSQTVASMLQHNSHASPVTITGNPGSISQQQQPQQQQQHTQQLPSISQQFLQPPVLQTLTVLPQQPRPILQQPVMNYNSIGSVGGHQILTTGLTSPLGIVQPLSMLGVTPGGAVIQNIPVQQVVPGPHFQSLTVLQGPQTVNSIPQEQSVVVNDTSAMGVHPSHLHSAFAGGSIVPNMVTANPVISTPVGGREMLINTTSQGSTVEALSQTPSLQQQYPPLLHQTLPPIAQTLSPTSCIDTTKVCRTSIMTTSVTTTHASVTPASVAAVSVTNTCNTRPENPKSNIFLYSKSEGTLEPNQNARSIGVQSGCTEQNAAVQTVSSANPVNSSTSVNSSDDSQNTKLSIQDSCLDGVKSKYEGENSNTLLSSGGESCESPWPDPVNLSAAVRAVVQEQADSNEDPLSDNPSSSSGNKIVSFIECSASINEETSDQPQSVVEPENIEDSSNGSSVLDLRTGSSQENNSAPQEDLTEAISSEELIRDSENRVVNLEEWNEHQLPVNQSELNDTSAENASTASSDTSEQTSTDCNVTSDSGVESSQEPMNLACIREGEDNIELELADCAPAVEEGDETVFVSFEDSVSKQDLNDRLAWKRGIKRHKLELEPSEEQKEEDSEDDTPSTPPLPPQPRTFNDGDLVWGQIRGFPSWPGKLVREEEVKGTHKTEDGKLWVRWFGDHTFTQVEPDKLKTLSEGLEAHHRARKKHRRGRKMNTQLENAIQEAMMELDRQTSIVVADQCGVESLLPPTEPNLTSETAISISASVNINPRTSRARGYRRR